MNDIRKYMNILNEDFDLMPVNSMDDVTGSPVSPEPVHNGTDDDYDNNQMMQSTLLQIIDNANALYAVLKSGKEVPSWALSKVTKSAENLEGVTNFMNYNELVSDEPDLNNYDL